MKKNIILILLLVLVCSCVSTQYIKRLEAENHIQKLAVDSLKITIGHIETSMNDTDKDGVPDYLDVEKNSIAGAMVDTKGIIIDRNMNGIADDIEKYLAQFENVKSSEKLIVANNNEKSAVTFFQQIAESGRVNLKDCFPAKTTLEQCRAKMEDALVRKLNINTNNIKYFAIDNDSFGIVTANECIQKNTGLALQGNAGCLVNKCYFNNFFCVHEGYSQSYVFLVVKKTLGNNKMDISEKQMREMFNDDELQGNPHSERFEHLFSDPSKVLSKKYDVFVKLIEFQKESKFATPRIILATYPFETKIKNIFKIK